MNDAEILWLWSCQLIMYHEDIASIKSHKSYPSIVKQLGLFLDSNTITRRNFRIFCHLNTTRLVLLYAMHTRNNYMLVQGLPLPYLLQKFWIPSARQCLRSVLQKCVTCKKTQRRPLETPDPPPLPKFWVNEEPPFTVTGFHYTGAVCVRNNDRTACQAHVCLFTCESTIYHYGQHDQSF